MTDPSGLASAPRQTASSRPVDIRIQDWHEVSAGIGQTDLERQAGRCMDCGIPFCHGGCPLGNLIPEWTDLIGRRDWREAAERLHATNNFPEFTGRLCPAPCEAACVLGINAEPVTIKQAEVEITDRAWAPGDAIPLLPPSQPGFSVAVVGSGPAGLAAAQQLTRAGHQVPVFERDDRPGGLLRYGIPEFKLEKSLLDRRLDQMRAEGTVFETGVEVGKDLPADQLLAEVDALVLAGGATLPRDLPVPGRDLHGVHQAMEYLPLANRVQEGDLDESPVSARGRRVVILGGGDTGADCLGTAHRQGAISVHQLEIMPQPPGRRDPSTPWPLWPLQLRTSAAHEEGGERLWSVSTQPSLGHGRGHLDGLVLAQVAMTMEGGRPAFTVVPDSETQLACALVLLALGFVGAERSDRKS